MKLGKVYNKKFKNKRIRKKFSFFPKILSNKEKIWLENYYSYQYFGPHGIRLGNEPIKYDWIEEFSCSTKKQLKDKLRIDYKELQIIKKSTLEFLKYIGLEK